MCGNPCSMTFRKDIRFISDCLHPWVLVTIDRFGTAFLFISNGCISHKNTTRGQLCRLGCAGSATRKSPEACVGGLTKRVDVHMYTRARQTALALLALPPFWRKWEPGCSVLTSTNMKGADVWVLCWQPGDDISIDRLWTATSSHTYLSPVASPGLVTGSIRDSKTETLQPGWGAFLAIFTICFEWNQLTRALADVATHVCRLQGHGVTTKLAPYHHCQVTATHLPIWGCSGVLLNCSQRTRRDRPPGIGRSGADCWFENAIEAIQYW